MEKIKVKYILYLGAFITLIFLGKIFFTNDEIIVISDNDLTTTSGEICSEIIYVHIIGEINEPGIKSIPKGSRMFELIDVSGGATENADLSRLNLASVLKDEQKIVVPSIVVEPLNKRYHFGI